MTKNEGATIAGGGTAEEGPPPCYVLRVVAGPDAGRSFVVDVGEGGRCLVGTSHLCDLVLGDRRVSRRHLALSPQGHRLRVVDLESSNGTRVGGLQIFDALLGGGETIELGETTLRITRAPGGERPAGDGRAFGRLIGESHAMKQLFDAARRLAATGLSLLVEGETGTGKSLLAESIHDASGRAGGPLVHLEASLSSADFEAELLGRDGRPGALDAAATGTLVLDEVAELEPAAQASLLRVLERGAYDGGNGVRAVDVRLVSTTRRNLDRDVQEGRFREDLFYRLAGARLEVPPLRDRHGDVALLAAHFHALFGGQKELSRAWVLRRVRHAWPGNVRELENAVASEVALSRPHGDEVEPTPTADPATVAAGSLSAPRDTLNAILDEEKSLQRARQRVVAELEQRFVERALAEHDGNVTRAAGASGLTRRYFHMLLAKRRHDD